MKKSGLYVIGLSVLMITCSPPKDEIKVIQEDGVEVVLNQIEPYQVRGEKTSLSFEDEITIDFGSDEIGELGIANATLFCADSAGGIYFCENDHEGDLICKFSPDGRFERSFGPKGQGPGEIQYAIEMTIDAEGRLVVSDISGRKILRFSQDGELIDEKRHPELDGSVTPLKNGHYLHLRDKRGDSREFYYWELVLLNSQMEEIKVLDVQKVLPPDFENMRGVNSRPYFKWKSTGDYIYVVSEDRGYEFLQFDLKGTLIRKIRKKYRPVPVSDEIIKKRTEQYKEFGVKAWFPKHWLPICNFVVDEEGRIFAMTFEIGKMAGEYIINIFNPSGLY
ncbi:MAG: 6-bladed beta-propeller, partial [Candidatus Aminicenantes bacterium]|nr:6-bladed beta-propeller [Candidatus Aminicenantes bacterium]